MNIPTTKSIEDSYFPISDTETKENIQNILYDITCIFAADEKEYKEMLFDLVLNLMSAKETPDRANNYLVSITLLYKKLLDLGEVIFEIIRKEKREREVSKIISQAGMNLR